MSTDTRKPAPAGQGCIYKRKNSWEALIQRQGKRYFKASKNREEAESWLEEMRATLPPPSPSRIRTPKPPVKKASAKRGPSDYTRIRATSEAGTAENVRKYRSMADEARTAAEAARAQRDAAAAKIRELQAKLGIAKKKEWWEL